MKYERAAIFKYKMIARSKQREIKDRIPITTNSSSCRIIRIPSDTEGPSRIRRISS